MNLLLSLSSKLLFFVILLGISFPTLYAQTQTEFILENLVPLLSHEKQFPHTTEQVLSFPPQLIRDNNLKLVRELENNDIYRSLIETHHPLLTLEINTEAKTGGVVQFKVVKESFISDWGQRLSAFVTENGFNNSDQILQEISSLLLEKPYLATTPHDFVSAFSQTLDRSVNREDIFRALERGDISILERVLDPYPKGRGFKPTAFALEPDREKEYYLDALREMMEVNERMDLLVTTYILAKEKEGNGATESLEKYLIELTEEKLVWIMEKGLQKSFSKTIANTQKTKIAIRRITPSQIRVSALPPIKARVPTVRRRILSRIKGIEREIKRHQEIVTEHAQVSKNNLTLVEVHPSVGIFRGYIGGDCSSSLCFGYSYNPMERVFFILNKRGEDVGYLNGTMVHTVDGKNAFLINGLAGAKISKEMATIIFSALSKAHEELGVEEVLLLGRKNHLSNLDYTEIRQGFDSHAGIDVPVTFLDQDFRKIIDTYSKTTDYDNPETLSIGHRMENIGEIRDSTSIIVSERPFVPPQLSDFKASDLSPKQKFFINLHYPNIAEELGINPLKNSDFAQEFEGNLVKARNLIEIIQNVDRLPVVLHALYLAYIAKHYSLSMKELNSYIHFEYLRGLVSASDFLGSSFYNVLIEDLEIAIAEAERPEDLNDYIIKVFPYVRGKKMGEIVERALDFIIEYEIKTKNILDMTAMDVFNARKGYLLWFAIDVFPSARVPNKARMIEKTIKAAVTLELSDLLTYLSYKTLPRIRIPQRRNLIEQTRSAIIELGDKTNLLLLGLYNNLGDERGWQIIQTIRRSENNENYLIRNLSHLTTHDYEQRLRLLRDYFSLTPEQFVYFFGIDEIIGRFYAKDSNEKLDIKRILELTKKIIEFKDPKLLQQLFIIIFPNFYLGGMWELIKKGLEVAIELRDYETIKEIGKRPFLFETLSTDKVTLINNKIGKGGLLPPYNLKVIRDLIHEFLNNNNIPWERFSTRFQTLIKPPDRPCF